MRLFDLLYRQLQENPISDAFAHKVLGFWKKYSTSDSLKIVNQLAQGLIELGIKPGDKISIVSEGRPEWCFVDMACQHVGAVLVPLYPTLSTAEYETILKEAEVKMIFVSNGTTLKSVAAAAKTLSIDGIYAFNKIGGVKSWLDVMREGKGKNKEELEVRMKTVKADDVCTIIYTSGTSGAPKGVMLTHTNIVCNVIESSKVSTLDKGKDRALSFLPLNHIYEKTGIYIYIYTGTAVYFAENLETIADNLKEVKPHTFNTVPRLLEKVYDKILKKGSALSTVKRGIFNRAITLGLKFDPNKNQGALYNRQLSVANKLVFSKWREALGGNIKQIQCGASALQPRLARVFWAAGIHVLEGYGLTETSPVISANRMDAIKIGSVGKVYDNLEVKLGEENEIMVKGPSVMKGYYKNDELTREVLSEDGWLKTGDVGKLVDGFLHITDRKKELFKTSGGLYIAPQQVENKLNEAIIIEQSMVVGEGEKFPAVLIVPNMDEVLTQLSGTYSLMDFEDMRKDPKVRKLFQSELDRVNEALGNWAKIKEFRLINKTWSPETGELTPTMKLKRRVILEKYKLILDTIYTTQSDFDLSKFENMQIEDMSLEELEQFEKMEAL
ncbi:long-chain fatty acid--CoA ligase [Ekhidna sp.]|uniref:AMP-dependent synthetase/ligase n=1 Tax=Ekhidna sp. TaxID=2608089 RepID=UPI003297A25E